MSALARQSRLTLRLAGKDYSVVRISGREEFNRPFLFQLWIVSEDYSLLTKHLGTSAELTMIAPDDQRRTLTALVSAVEHEQDLPDSKQIWKFEISSQLYRLQQTTDTRLLLDRTLPAIIAATCGRHNLGENNLSCDWTRAFPTRPTTLQARESDFDFIARLCSRNGILFWSEFRDGQEILCFSDSSTRCEPLPRNALVYNPAAGLDKTISSDDILTLTERASLISDRYAVHDVTEANPRSSALCRAQPAGQAASRT